VEHRRDTRNWICLGADGQHIETKAKFVRVQQAVFWHAGCFIKLKKISPRTRLETARAGKRKTASKEKIREENRAANQRPEGLDV
jgi:hypothetical protein